MKILYVAKHDSGDNDDEGAISFSLEKLGHEVVKVHELRRHRTRSIGDVLRLGQFKFDFCLFHKWETVSEIADVSKIMPCVFWYFDLLSNTDDPTLAARMEARRRWFYGVIPHCVAAFLTDGDWVQADHEPMNSDIRPKLHWLMQGADERYVGPGEPRFTGTPGILFTGTRHHGKKREEHVARLEARYGSRFGVVGETRRSPRKHGRELADLFASARIVVAPDGPCTDRYWSNRVYLTLGLGGFLLHPYCEGLVRRQGGVYPQYTHDELYTYHDRDELEDEIDSHLDDPSRPGEEGSREYWIEMGLKATVERNLYRHRCEQLVNVVRGLL